jgi:hypothetical protein
VIAAQSARAISNTTSAFLLFAFAALLLASALAWYKYASRYQERVRSKLPRPLQYPIFKKGSLQQQLMMQVNRNFGAIFLFLTATWALILGIKRL